MRAAHTPLLGPIIQKSRKDLSIDRVTFSRRIKVTTEQLDDIESGEHVIPLTILLRAAAVLDARPSKWFDELGSSEYTDVASEADDYVEILQDMLRRTKKKRA